MSVINVDIKIRNKLREFRDQNNLRNFSVALSILLEKADVKKKNVKNVKVDGLNDEIEKRLGKTIRLTKKMKVELESLGNRVEELENNLPSEEGEDDEDEEDIEVVYFDDEKVKGKVDTKVMGRLKDMKEMKIREWNKRNSTENEGSQINEHEDDDIEIVEYDDDQTNPKEDDVDDVPF